MPKHGFDGQATFALSIIGHKYIWQAEYYCYRYILP